MEDYRLDELERPTHHPNAVRRLNGADRPGINFSGRGEQPGQGRSELLVPALTLRHRWQHLRTQHRQAIDDLLDRGRLEVQRNE
jgi:hypothetical protein